MKTRRSETKRRRPAHRPGRNGLATQHARSRLEPAAIQSAANAYCLHHYAVAFGGGTAYRLRLNVQDLWIVPVVFTSPGIGAVGEVGMLAIDAATHEVIAATPRAQVRAAAAHLAQEKRDEINAAFHRARTAR